ncbi:hypothetical protein FIC_01175 [Flavobacteriaceae bacterium 3519-10]|nr:hypothetical protein FIC_01175 [Flavobacteriaceae bacterium 3519-10]
MKKLSLIISMLAVFFMTSCRDIVNTVLDALPPFDVPFSTNLAVPFAGVSTTTYTRTPEIPMNINLDAKIKENNPNYSINNLKSVKLNSLKLDWVSSSLDTRLDVIKNARLYVKAPNQPEKLIATAYDNTNPQTITFTVVDEELLNYFRTSQNSLIFEVMAAGPAADQITMSMSSGFKIRVQL